MLLKVVLTASTPAATVTISGPLGTQGNTSMAELSEQLIKWYREIIT